MDFCFQFTKAPKWGAKGSHVRLPYLYISTAQLRTSLFCYIFRHLWMGVDSSFVLYPRLEIFISVQKGFSNQLFSPSENPSRSAPHWGIYKIKHGEETILPGSRDPRTRSLFRKIRL